MYTFKNENALDCDLLVGNWFSCTFPQARWVTCLYVARIVGPDCDRHHILNDEYVVRKTNGLAIKRKLESLSVLLDLLSSVFGIVLAPDTDMTRISAFFRMGASPSFHAPAYMTVAQ